jgi:hypothetical protein
MAQRKRLGSILGTASAVGFLATAGLHGTGYAAVSGVAREGPEDLHTLVPMLWVAFSADLVVIGVIVLVVAWWRNTASSLVLIAAGCMPAIAAGLQIAYLGFVPPTAILIALAVLTWAAAIAMRGHSESPA